MEDYCVRSSLKEKYFTQIRNSESEDKFIDEVRISFQHAVEFPAKSLQVLLDMALAVIDQTGNYCDPNIVIQSDEGNDQDESGGVLYDADDEGSDETLIFPCHITFDDCHPELLSNYHRENLKNRNFTQIVKHPKICQFVLDHLFRVLKSNLSDRHADPKLDGSRSKKSPTQTGSTFEACDGRSDEGSNSLSQHLNLLVSLINRLNKVCTIEKRNCRILASTNILDALMETILLLVQKTPDKQYLYLESLLRFAFSLADYRITSNNLKQLFSIMKSESVDLKTVLTSFERLLSHQYRILKNIKPLKSINFPIASRTAEELECDSYISNSWHSRLRSKVIEFKKKRSRTSESDFSSMNHSIHVNSDIKENHSASNEKNIQKVTPSWLECSVVAPLSNISPLISNGEVKFCCSLWLSVCGDLLVVDTSKAKKVLNEHHTAKIDWENSNSHWIRLASKRRLAGKYRAKTNHSRSRRPSMKIKQIQAYEREDEEREEKDKKNRRSEQELNQGLYRSYSFRLKHHSSNLIRTPTPMKSRDHFNRKTPSASPEPGVDKSRPPKEFLGRRARNNSQELLMHLISFALDTLTIEIWLNMRSMTFCARACRLTREGQTNLLDQVTFPSHLQANDTWSHLVFCLEESNNPKNSHEKVMNLEVIVDGIHEEQEKLTYATHKNPLSNFACLVGCERSTFGYVWKLTQFNVYKSTPPKDIPMFLLGKGPDFWSFTNFRQQSTLPLADITQRSIKKLLNPRMLELYSKVDEERSLNWLTQNVILAYVAHQADFFLDYSTSMTTSSLMNPLPIDYEFSNSSERFIQARLLIFSRCLRFNTNHGFGTALVEAGGIESVLVCFADVVRRSDETSTTHASAFSILLKMSQTNPHHLGKFLDDLNGLKLSEFILVHPDCVVSKSMLDSYIDFCLMKKEDHSLIKSPKLLYHLLSSWRAWHKDVRIAKLLYRRLIRLLQPIDSFRRLRPEKKCLESHYIDHNFRMLTEAGGIDILMGILRECLVPLEENQPKINHDLVELIVNLISLLIKHPPGQDVLFDIMEFLLFLHPDPKAYVDTVSDKGSFLRDLNHGDRDISMFDNVMNNSRTPLSETSSEYRSSAEDLAEIDASRSIESINRENNCSRATSKSASNSDYYQDRDVDTGLEEFPKNVAKLVKRQCNQATKRSKILRDNVNLDRLVSQKNQTAKQTDESYHDTNQSFDAQKCSNRNFAMASIADMLASIVKLLTSTDPDRILSEALQKWIIDVQKLIVLANNESSLVREKVLRLFLYCIRACYSLNLKPILTKYEEDSSETNFKTCIPIQLMARQLLKYPSTIKMIQFCYGIIVGIDDFETVETVCLIFDIETLNNNLQLNTLILLINLMTKLKEPKEIVSAIKFVHAYVKQLLHLNESNVLTILVKNSLIESLMKIYFSYVEHEVSKMSMYGQQFRDDEQDVYDDYIEVRDELDRMLILIVKHFMQNLSTSEAIKSIEELLAYFDLINNHIPMNFRCTLRDRKVKVLTAIISYCKHYEECARQKTYSGGLEFWKIFKNNNLNTFSNELSTSNLRIENLLDADHTSKTSDKSLLEPMKSSKTKFESKSRVSNGNGFYNDDSDEDYQSNSGSSRLEDESPGNGIYDGVDRKKISEDNVIERFRATFDLAIRFIITRESAVIASPLERKFIIKCVQILSNYLSEGHSFSKLGNLKQRNHWYMMLPKLREQTRYNFRLLVLYLLSPCDSMNLDERRYYALQLLEMFSVEELLALLGDKTTYRVLLTFVKDLIDYNTSSLDSEISVSEDEELLEDDTEVKLRELVKTIEDSLEPANMGIQNGYMDKNKRARRANDDGMKLDIKFRDVWLSELDRMREDSREKVEAIEAKFNANKGESAIDVNESKLDRILEEGSKITRDVVDDKHKQRKAYLEFLKQNKVLNYHIRQQWLSLIIGHTHERAVWFMKDHYPQCWELNPVEGPSRIRRRLRPCKLSLESRFLRRPEQDFVKQADKLEKKSGESSLPIDFSSDDWYNHYCPHPLCFMIINYEQDSNELRTRMFTTDRIYFNCDCSIIRPNEVCEGEISIASSCVHFIGERSDNYRKHLKDKFVLDKTVNCQNGEHINSASKSIKYHSSRSNTFTSTIVEDLWFDEIVEVWDRRYQLQDVGLEIFLTNNMTYLIGFRNNADREDFKQNLMREQNKMFNLQRFNLNTNPNKLNQLWRDGRLTNFDYLTCLNKLAGRSFNDLMQYPVFPFILSNYTAKTLNLEQPSNFRKLQKPMAIQNPEKEVNFISNYQNTQSTILSAGLSSVTQAYHYSNHYSNSATVLHFLVRLPPFTQMLIQYQDNNFDQPDRTFHSVANTWQLITRDSNTDFKELIPEFFYLPEMFLNFEQFELGRKQNNEIVDDVKLPPWCPNSDARLFTLIHRQALESSYVSENLHQWVDLIFGYKQTGKAAVDAINVFHPATYYGMIDLNTQQSSLNSSINSAISAISERSSAHSSDYITTPDLPPYHSPASLASTCDTGSRLTIMNDQYKRQQADIERLALETMIKTYGQMPRQLFAQPVKQRSLSTFAQTVMTEQTSEKKFEVSKKGPRRIEPLRQVKGLRWGSFVGSPDEADITVVRHRRIVPEDVVSANFKQKMRNGRLLNQSAGTRFKLSLLPNGEIAILKESSSLMLDYESDRKSSGNFQLSLPSARSVSRRVGLSRVARMNLFSNMIISRQQFSYIEPKQFSTSAQFESTNAVASSLVSRGSSRAKFSRDSLSLISWSYLDGIIRIRRPATNNQKLSLPLVQADSTVDVMTTCASVPELNLLLVGYRSGSICAHIITTSHQTAPIFQYVPQTASSFSTSTSSSTLSHATSGQSSISHDGLLERGDSYVAGTTPVLQSFNLMNKASRWLYCHRKRVNCLKINVSFGIVVTGSDDGTSVVWDLNSLTYVRTIDYKVDSLSKRRNLYGTPNQITELGLNRGGHDQVTNQQVLDYLCSCDQPSNSLGGQSDPEDNLNTLDYRQRCVCASGVHLVAISDTLGDIVSVKHMSDRVAECDNPEKSNGNLSASSSQSESSLSSVVYVHTINGSLIGFFNCYSQVTDVCYSNAPEGISVNVIVVGLAEGIIRLYSSWDLNRVKEFHVSGLNLPITSLMYSNDNQLLYVTYEDGQLIVLRNKKKNSIALPKEWFL